MWLPRSKLRDKVPGAGGVQQPQPLLRGPGPYLTNTLQTPKELLGLNSAKRPADGWPTSTKGTPLNNFGMPVPSGSDPVWAGVLRRNAWNNFALSFTRSNADPIYFANGTMRGCKETVQMEW
jgi:hypothetical protein